MIEVAARSIGGLCARTLRFGAGISLEEVILRHALGHAVEHAARELDAAGVMMLPIPRAGMLVEVRGQDARVAVPGIVGLEITVPRGRPSQPLPEGDRYLGFLFARAATPAEVEAALRAAHAELDVVLNVVLLPARPPRRAPHLAEPSSRSRSTRDSSRRVGRVRGEEVRRAQ